MAPEDDRSNGRAGRDHDIARAAFRNYDWNDVLDLTHDSLLDTPSGVTDVVRRLRFAGHDLAVEVDVHGSTQLTFDVRVIPEQDVTVHITMMSDAGPKETPWSPEVTVPWSKPQLTSFLLRWKDDPERAVRTAWVLI